MTRIIRKTLAAWQRWRFYRAFPAIRALDMQAADARRRHKATRRYEDEKRRIVTEALRGANAGR